MSQSDVITIISSDEEAAPLPKPSKKARKPRLQENNILMGQKDQNTPQQRRKKDTKSPAERIPKKRPPKITDTESKKIENNIKIQPLGPVTQKSSKPVIDDLGLLKQFEAATAALPRDAPKSPSRAPKVRITKRAPVVKPRDNLKDMTGVGHSELIRSRNESDDNEEVNRAKKTKMRPISKDIEDDMDTSTYVNMFPEKEISARSSRPDVSGVAGDVFQGLFMGESPPKRPSPDTSKTYVVTNSPENKSPIDISSSPEPDDPGALPSKLTPREIVENSGSARINETPKKKPLKSAMKNCPAKKKTKKLDLVPGEDFKMCPLPPVKTPSKKRRISIEEYKKKHCQSTEKPSPERVNAGASTTNSDLHDQVIKQMPKFFNSEDEQEIPADRPNLKENASCAQKKTPVSPLNRFVPDVPTATLPQTLQETSQKNPYLRETFTKRSITIKKSHPKDPRLNRKPSKSPKKPEPENVISAKPKSPEKISCLKNMLKSPENTKKHVSESAVEKSPAVSKTLASPLSSKDKKKDKPVSSIAESSTTENEPLLTKKLKKAPRVSLQSISWNSSVHSQKEGMSEAGSLEKERPEKVVDNKICSLQADSPQSGKKTLKVKEGPPESLLGALGLSPLIPEVKAAPVLLDEEEQSGNVNSSLIEGLGDETAEANENSRGTYSVLDLLNSSDDSVSATLTVEAPQKPLNKRVNEIAEEIEEREPDSIDDDLPLLAFVEKKERKISENEISVGKNNEKENADITGKPEIVPKTGTNSVAKEIKKSKNKSKTTSSKATPNKEKKNLRKHKKVKKSQPSQKVDGEKKAEAPAPATLHYGTVLDSDEEEEERKRKAQNEGRAMVSNIKKEIGLDMLQTKPLQDTSVTTSASETKSEKKDELSEHLKEYNKSLKIFRDEVRGRVTENKSLLKTVPVNKNLVKDKEYCKTRKILPEVPISEDFCRDFDFERSVANEHFDRKLRDKAQLKYEKLKKNLETAKTDFEYKKGACENATGTGKSLKAEKSMKEAQEKYIELDQAFDVIAAHLNGRPVLEESKFEACKETSDTLFMTREIIPFVAPYRSGVEIINDKEKRTNAHFKKWISEKNGKYTPTEIEIEQDTKLWEPTAAKLIGRRRLNQANAIDDEIDELMASAFTPIGSAISKLIPWKTDNLGEKYDELVPEPVLDPKFNKELRHELAFDPESEMGCPPSPQPSESNVNADPPGFVSDEEFELTDEIGLEVEPESKRSVNFDNRSSMPTMTIDNLPDIDSLPRKVERTKSLGPEIDFPHIRKPDKQRRASADNFDLKINLRNNSGEDNDRKVSAGSPKDNGADSSITKSVVPAEKKPDKMEKAPSPESSLGPQFKLLERIDYQKPKK